jgi:CRP-like cAMP-binding protein
VLTNTPLPYSIRSLEPCQYRQLSVSDYLEFVQTHDAWRTYHEQQLALHLVNKEWKEAFLLLNSPEQRVAQFNQIFPNLVARLPDYIIASYLGITPISYCRIKKRLGSIS